MTNHHGVVNKVDFKCFTPEGMARQLENYTRGIYKVLEDYQVLYGSAVAMRKAIDSMGAYLIVNCCGGGEVNPVTDGTSDKSNRNPILNRISKEKDQSIREFKTKWEIILPDRNSTEGLQFLLHYQVPAVPDQLYRDEEKKNLKQDYTIFFNHLLDYRNIVITFLKKASEVTDRVHANKEEFSTLFRFLSDASDFDTQINENKAQRAFVEQNAGHAIDGIYSNTEDNTDPWMNWHCRILSQYSDQKENELSRDLCALICRKIGERTTRCFLQQAVPDHRIDPKATYEDYLQLCAKIPSNSPQYFKAVELNCLGKMISTNSNDCLHWHAADNEYLAAISKTKGEHYQDNLWAAAKIVSGEITDQHPEYAFKWYSEINKLKIITDAQFNKRLEETEKEMARIRSIANRNRVIAICTSIAALIAIIAAVWLGIGKINENAEKTRKEQIFTSFYTNYTWRYGVPEGIAEITKDEASSKAHYEFDVQDNRVIEVRLTDANGYLMDEITDSFKGRPAVVRIDYSDERADEVSFFDANQQFLLTAKYEYDPDSNQISCIRLLDQTRHALSLPYSTSRIKLNNWLKTDDDQYAPKNSGITALTIKEMENGQIKTLSYGWDEIQTDGKGISGASFTYTDGMIETISFDYGRNAGGSSDIQIRKFRYAGSLLKEEEIVYAEGEIKTIHYTRDQNGNCTAETYTDPLNARISDRKDLAEITYSYSPEGRVTETRRYGTDGYLIATGSGWAVKQTVWDDSGRELSCAYLDAFEKPVLVNGWARRESEYEDTADGVRRIIHWYDENGNPGIKDLEYVSGINTITRTDSGRILTYERFHEDGTRSLYDGAYQWKETEDRNGNLIRIDLLDENGNLMLSEKKQFAYKENTYEHRRLSQEVYYGTDGKPCKGNRIYSKRTFEYTPSGLQQDIRAYDQDRLVRHKHIDYENGNSGRVTREEYLDADGHLTVYDDIGYAYKEIKYKSTGKGTLVRTEYHDADGNLQMISASSGIRYAYTDNEYDPNGYQIRETLYDDQGIQVYSPSTGCYTLIAERDGRGNYTAWEFRDQNDQPMMNGEEKGYARTEKEYNRNNQVIEVRLYDQNRQLFVSSAIGYARRKYLYDEQTGLFLGTEFYDEKGNLMICPSYGYAKLSREYDADGNIVKELFYDETGNLYLVPDSGYAVMEMDYEDGKMIEKRFYDAEGNIAHTGGKRPIQHWTYQDGILQAFDGFDADHTLRVHTDHHPDGSSTERVYYTAEESAEKGCAGIIRERDADSNLLKETLVDENGSPVFSDKEGFAVCFWDRNAADHTRKLTYYNEKNERIVNQKDGFSARIDTLNENEQIIHSLFLDENDQPMIRLNSEYASYDRIPNEKGQVTEERYYGIDGEPIILSSGASGYRWTYDEDGNILSVIALNTEGQPFKDLGENDGIDQREFYDEKGQVIKLAFYDSQGNLINHPSYGYAYIENTWNEAGKKTSISLFNAEGRLTVSDQLGYARVVDEYDEEGRSLGWAYYGPDELPMDNEVAGYARKVSKRDSAGNEIEVNYYSSDGAPCVPVSLGYARVVREYNAANQITLESYYGEDGLPVDANDIGSYGFRVIYDEAGRMIRKEFLGPDGELIRAFDEDAAILRYEYNEAGQMIRVLFYDEEDNPMLCDDGTWCYGKQFEYNEAGKNISVSFLDQDGTLIKPNSDIQIYDYSMMKFIYDENGNYVANTLCNSEGIPFVSKSEGYCTKKFTLDKNEYITWEEFYDTDDQKMLNTVLGFASAKYELDEEGYILSEAYYDLDGNEIDPVPQPVDW